MYWCTVFFFKLNGYLLEIMYNIRTGWFNFTNNILIIIYTFDIKIYIKYL